MAKILVIDDDQELLELLKFMLKSKGYDVMTSSSGEQGLNRAMRDGPDLVILDLMMPAMDGLEICRNFRTLSNVPIIMLTARADETSMVQSLEAGADDYVLKPCDTSVLLAKVKALLRRANTAAPTGLYYQDDYLVINLARGEILVTDETVRLTPTEQRLLTYLYRNSDRVVPHDELIREVWGSDESSDRRLLKLYILYLRRKIEADPENPAYLRTAWGVGYRFHIKNGQ